MKEEILYIKNIRGRYKDRITLDNVSFRIYQGEIICILGYGNAGKSALFKLLSGCPLTGTWDVELYRKKQRVTFDTVAEARRNGIVLVGDHPSVFPKISVERNLYLLSHGQETFLQSGKLRGKYAQVLRRFGLSYSLQKPLEQMRGADWFVVEILGAYLSGAKIILLDCTWHFTSGTDRETFRRVVQVLREEGVTVLYSSSNVDEDGEAFSDRILLFHEGMKIAELSPEQYTERILDVYTREKVIPQIVGREGSGSGKKPFAFLQWLDKKDKKRSLPVCRGELVMIFSRHNTAFEKILRSLRSGLSEDVELILAENKEPAGSDWILHHCCTVDTLDADQVLFGMQISVLDNICMCMDSTKFLRPDIRSALKRSNRELIELAGRQNRDDRLTALTVMKILRQRILLSRYELCVFVKPERGLDPVETAAVYEEIRDIAQHEIACIVMTDDEIIFEHYQHLENAHQ